MVGSNVQAPYLTMHEAATILRLTAIRLFYKSLWTTVAWFPLQAINQWRWRELMQTQSPPILITKSSTRCSWANKPPSQSTIREFKWGTCKPIHFKISICHRLTMSPPFVHWSWTVHGFPTSVVYRRRHGNAETAPNFACLSEADDDDGTKRSVEEQVNGDGCKISCVVLS